jgi:hypothetical protein
MERAHSSSSAGGPGAHHSYLRSRVRIGSCKGPVSYKSQQQVFHHDDVPSYARERKEEVVDWVSGAFLVFFIGTNVNTVAFQAKSKILIGDDSWKRSNKFERPVCERRRMENHVKDRKGAYQYNFRAESLDPLRNEEPFDKPTKFHFSQQPETMARAIETRMREGTRVQKGIFTRVEENPNHPNLRDAPSWNNSTFFTARDREVNRNAYTTMTMDACKTNRSKILNPANYLKPIETTNKLQEVIRQKKADGTFTWKKLINRDESLDEPVDRSLLKNRFPSEKSSAIVTTKHSGTWEFNPVEGRYV